MTSVLIFFAMLFAALCYVAYELRRSFQIMLEVARQQHGSFALFGTPLTRLMDMAEADKEQQP